jgi:hypothetical protein
MHEGVCPSCTGTEIYAARNGVALGENLYVGLRPHLEPGFRGAVRLHQSDQIWSYVCATCGLMEQRLHDPAAVEFIRATWVRVKSAT